MQLPDTLFVGSSELAALMRHVDWRHTPLGPADSWPQSVRTIIRMMLTSRYAMWMGWGPDLTFFYNDAYARMTLGVKHPWALGRPAREVWMEIWPEIGPRIAHVLATGEATWDEGLLLFLERSGFREETYHTFSYSPLHQDDGSIAGMFCVVTEETDRVMSERRLAVLRELASQLASSQSTADVWRSVERSLESDARDLPFTLTYLVNPDGRSVTRVASTNAAPTGPAAREALGIDNDLWPIQQIVEESADNLIVELRRDLPWPASPWTNAPTHAMVLPIRGQGHTRPVGVFVAGLNPYRPVDLEYRTFVTLYVGQLAAGLASAQAHAAEHRRAEALAQIDRAKTTFFSNVSHELRTPLTLILGPVTDALDTEEHALKGDTLDLVYRNGLRLRKLVNALLDFSRIEAGRVDANFEPVDLGLLTAELASVFRSAVERAGLRFIVDCESGDEPAYVDHDIWEKIVLNLISNAFKFTFDGEIAVSVRREGSSMLLQVRDTGIGIPREELPRLFVRFHRVEGAIGRTHEGTGIGLALVHELVKLQGGRIGVESELGRGTTFTVTIPLGSAHLPADRIRQAKTSTSGGGRADTFIEEVRHWLPGDGEEGLGGLSAAQAAPVDNARILLADDNADMRSYLKDILGRRWTVDAAADGLRALRLARELAPDMVITDVMMPRLDGFGLLRELRVDDRTRHIPVMMLSARAGDDSRLEGFQAGADEYLAKPFTVRELLAKVEGQLFRAKIRTVEERSARRVAAVFAQTPVPIAIVRGPYHAVEIANASFVALVDRAVVGQRMSDAVPELRDQGVIDLLDRVYATHKPYVSSAVAVTLHRGPQRAAERCVLDLSLQPLFDQAGAIEGVAVVLYEVTELDEARHAAESANRTKDEFLAMLGHELRNPLAPILTALQLLRLRGGDAGERERTIIERQVRHLVALVDDLLDISRITRGKVRLHPEPIELHEVVSKAIELASPLLEQHQHDLETDVPPTGLVVLADAARLAQVLSNLLTNAAKYTPAGGRIRVQAAADGPEVVLSVADSGIGIDPAMLPHIFDLFTQDRQAIDRAQGGMGLGLAIVRSLVALHGGSVTARSGGQGAGSEFIIRLPKMQAGSIATAPDDSPSYTRDRRTLGVRVLVVDDNRDAALMLADALAAAGHTTETAHDGPMALDASVRFKPDVALLDIGLPVMDGFELARQFRARPDAKDLKLVAITGYGQDHDRRRSAAAGFDAHLVKPVDIDHLSRLIGDLASRLEENTPGASPPVR
jgi:signal transduction histidine kinase/DNA-binding response OmpR family regulator